MVWESGLGEALEVFLASEKNVDLFCCLEDKTEREVLKALVKANCIDEPLVYEEEKKALDQLDRQRAHFLKDNFIRAHEAVGGYVLVGRRIALCSLNDIVKAAEFNATFKVEFAEAKESLKESTKKSVYPSLGLIVSSLSTLNHACVVGEDLNKKTKDFADFERRALEEGEEVLGIRMHSNDNFQKRIEVLLFKAYRFLFAPECKDQTTEQNTLLEQAKLREEIVKLSKQSSEATVALLKSENLSCAFLVTSILSILNKQTLEADAYVRLAKLNDSQLVASEHQFLQSRFRSMGLILTDQLIRCSIPLMMFLGAEGLKSGFALCDGGLVMNFASDLIVQPFKELKTVVFLPFLRAFALLIR